MIRKLAALAGGWLQDPYVCCTLGSLLLLRGLDAIAAQAKELGEQLAQVQAQAAAAANGQGLRAAVARDRIYAAAGVDPDAAPPAPVDVAGEHEDLHP